MPGSYLDNASIDAFVVAVAHAGLPPLMVSRSSDCVGRLPSEHLKAKQWPPANVLFCRGDIASQSLQYSISGCCAREGALFSTKDIMVDSGACRETTMNKPLAAIDDVTFGNPVARDVTLMLVSGLNAHGYLGDQRDSR